MIVKRKGGYHVLSESGKNLGGPYSSKSQAVKRLQQVEFFKHSKSVVDPELVKSGKYELCKAVIPPVKATPPPTGDVVRPVAEQEPQTTSVTDFSTGQTRQEHVGGNPGKAKTISKVYADQMSPEEIEKWKLRGYTIGKSVLTLVKSCGRLYLAFKSMLGQEGRSGPVIPPPTAKIDDSAETDHVKNQLSYDKPKTKTKNNQTFSSVPSLDQSGRDFPSAPKSMNIPATDVVFPSTPVNTWNINHKSKNIVGVVFKSEGDKLSGGVGDDVPFGALNKKQLNMGKKVEMEHTNKPKLAKEIAGDHLSEQLKSGKTKKDQDYYTKLKKVESGGEH